MKRLFPLLFCALPFAGYSQLGSGLVAHWRMNGNAGDSSGNGHHGTAFNVTPTTGIDGTPNSALQFNGINSRIDVPYSAQLNLTQLSICAKIKPLGYYTGACQVNFILCYHGGSNASYYLDYQDNPWDSDDCSTIDTGGNVFDTKMGPNTPPVITWQDTPIVSNRWYTVVSTYDSANIRLYINGVLRKIVYAPLPISTGAGSAGILTIGANQAGATSFPYWVNGVMDDVRLYNRPLTPGEVAIYSNPALNIGGPQSQQGTVALEFSPNPARAEVYVSTPKGSVAKGELLLINAVGQTVSQQTVVKDNTTLNIAGLPAGIYLLRYVNKEYVATGRLVCE